MVFKSSVELIRGFIVKSSKLTPTFDEFKMLTETAQITLGRHR